MAVLGSVKVYLVQGQQCECKERLTHTSGLVYKIEQKSAGHPPQSCRTVLSFGPSPLDTIIDTGATFTVMSKDA